jgi:hypothetical protein
VRAPIDLLTQARRLLAEAASAVDAGEQFRLAHFAALRTAAALSAERDALTARRRRLTNVWVLLEKSAPEHAGWARHFAAGAAVRAAVEAGVSSAVSPTLAHEELRAAERFLAVAEASVGLLAA